MTLSSKDIMAQFYGHFDNLASAAKKSGAALDQLAATTTTQYSEIKSLLASLKAAAGNGSYTAAAGTAATPSITLPAYLKSLAMSPRPLVLPLLVLERPSTRDGMTSCPVVLPIAPDASGPLALK